MDVAENKDLGALLVRKQLQRAQITLGMDGWSKDFPQELPRAGLKADWFSDPCIYGELFQTLLGWYQDQTALGNSLVRFCQENRRLEVNSVLGVNTDERERLLISE